eukprot:scaffold121403_cov18-Tisochrysis_lutea.AAC.1
MTCSRQSGSATAACKVPTYLQVKTKYGSREAGIKASISHLRTLFCQLCVFQAVLYCACRNVRSCQRGGVQQSWTLSGVQALTRCPGP